MPGSERGPSLIAEVGWLIAKDGRSELRSVSLVAVSLLTVACVVTACALTASPQARPTLASAAIWVSLALSSVLSASHAYRREQAGGALRALLLGPLRPSALFLGKTFWILLATGLGAVAAVGLTAVLIHDRALVAWPGHLLLVVGLGALGFAIIGGLFAPLLGMGSGRDMLLALMLLPLGVPLVASGARATSSLFAGDPRVDGFLDAVGMVAGLDGVFLLLAMWLFEPLVRRGS
jgi:heme exporter protein B